MTYDQSSYTVVRFVIDHFVRRVPADVQQYYRSDRVNISLRTKSVKAAALAAQSNCSKFKCNANYVSAVLNKWLKHRLPEGCVIQSFRHSLRDRLQAVECPSDIIDSIGRWATAGIGHKYGKGHDLLVKQR